jgi:hypothetical protein
MHGKEDMHKKRWKERDHKETLAVDAIILKWMLMTQEGRLWTALAWLRIERTNGEWGWWWGVLGMLVSHRVTYNAGGFSNTN